jgi:hypothetical protein
MPNPAGRRPRWDNRGTASTVTSIRPGRQITEPRTQSSDNLEEHALYTTAYVKVNCQTATDASEGYPMGCPRSCIGGLKRAVRANFPFSG